MVAITGTDAIRSYSRGLAALGADGDLELPVPTCGDWLLADLLWHLLEVQDFWAFIIESRPDGPDAYVQPPRPAASDLADGLRSATERLSAALETAGNDEAAWSWSDDHTVGFSVRRQSHEALVHYVDGLLACAQPLPDIDPNLAADGVDELVTVMLGGIPEWATYQPASGVIELRATDTKANWFLEFGRVTGTDPDSGNDIDRPCTELVSDREPDTMLSGLAIDLDLWLWGRLPADTLRVDGDPALVLKLRQLVIDASQ